MGYKIWNLLLLQGVPKKYLSEISGSEMHMKNLDRFGPCQINLDHIYTLSFLDHLDHFGLFLPFWTILDHFGPFGPFWAVWTVWTILDRF